MYALGVVRVEVSVASTLASRVLVPIRRSVILMLTFATPL
jgi:hypothetical protein